MPNAPKAPVTAREQSVMDTLDARRRDVGLTQAGLARAAGVSQGQVSRMLSGERPATLTELMAMCAALGVPLSEVLRDSGL